MSTIVDFILAVKEFWVDKPCIPFLLLFFANNSVLYYAWRKDKKYRASELVKLEQEANNEKRKYSIEELKEEIKPQTGFTWTFCICICLDIWMVGAFSTHLWAAHYFQEVKEEDSSKALFGDSFGAVNALISAFAFAGMLVAFFLQRYELRLQRKELQLTRDEMNEQTLQFKKQNDTLLKERFENTFFHMMELQQEIVAGLTYETKQIVQLKEQTSREVRGYITKETPVDLQITGRNLFTWSFLKMPHEIIYGEEGKLVVNGMKAVLEKRGFKEYTNKKSATLYDHYFRHLYTILKFIDKNDAILTPPEQYQYASFLRATLSRYELVWLYYNGLSAYGNEKLKPLIERYCMLKNIREDLLACSRENLEIFNKAGLNREMVKVEGYSGTDYEFYITAERNDKTKYHVSAFFNTPQSQNEAIKRIEEWNCYLRDRIKK